MFRFSSLFLVFALLSTASAANFSSDRKDKLDSVQCGLFVDGKMTSLEQTISDNDDGYVVNYQGSVGEFTASASTALLSPSGAYIGLTIKDSQGYTVKSQSSFKPGVNGGSLQFRFEGEVLAAIGCE